MYTETNLNVHTPLECNYNSMNEKNSRHRFNGGKNDNVSLPGGCVKFYYDVVFRT